MAEVLLLGGVGAVDGDGTALDVGPPKCRLVLAALAVHHGEAVPVPRIVDLVWGGHPPGTATKILQGYVSRLRKVLGDGAIARVGAAYRLERGVDVDVTRFTRLAAAGDVDGALATWAGSPIAGLDPVGLQPAVDGLEERWLDLTEQQLQRLAQDDPGGAVARLTELTESHPFREGLWGALMLALARSDRQADALAAFQRARGHLVDELGIDPGPRLRGLEARILAGELAPDSGGDGSAGSPRGESVRSVPDQVGRMADHSPSLPPATDLLGRDRDVEVILGALPTASLVTLLGPGGIGKTSLAVAVARRWHEVHGGRVTLVELDEVSDPDAVVATVAKALGVVEPADGDLQGAIVSGAGARPTLLVLDNCEHVLGGARALVTAFHADASTTRLLATSRERLGTVREHLHPVEPLDPAEDGAELFVRRASAVAPALGIETERATVEEICRQLDGVPLAIELAAARSGSLTPVQLLDRLGDRLRLLVTRGDRPDRQATLEGAVAWSYDLLEADEQRVFLRLSVFVGPFDLGAAEAVATDGDLDAIDVARLLGDLVDRSMVTTLEGPTGRRFRLLETLRQFAAARLAEDGEAAEVASRHGAWVGAETARIGAMLAGPDEVAGVERLDEIWPNLRSAVDRATSAGDTDVASALIEPVVVETDLRRRGEIGDWAERILAAGPEDDDSVVYWLLWALHRHVQSQNTAAFYALVERYGHADHPLILARQLYAEEKSEASLEVGPAAVGWLEERGHDRAADLIGMTTIGAGLMTTGRLDEALEFLQDLATRYSATGPPTMHYFSLGFVGYTQQLLGQLEEARSTFLAAADIEVPRGTFAVSRPAEIDAILDLGDHDRARRLLLEQVDDVLAMGTVDVARLLAVVFVNLMVVLGRPRDAAPALAYLDTAGEFGAMARASLVAEAAAVIGDVEPHDGDGGAALRQMRAALSDPGHPGQT